MDALNLEKYEQAILFFAHTCNNLHLGKTKLMKLLYYLDFDHYERFDVPVTGDTYFKYPHGPVPSSAETVIDVMEHRGLLEKNTAVRGNYRQHRVNPLVAYDLSVFTDTERETLLKVCERWSIASLSVIEGQTHLEAPWLAVEDWGEIPYEYAYYRNTFGAPDLSDEEGGYISPEMVSSRM